MSLSFLFIFSCHFLPQLLCFEGLVLEERTRRPFNGFVESPAAVICSLELHLHRLEWVYRSLKCICRNQADYRQDQPTHASKKQRLRSMIIPALAARNRSFDLSRRCVWGAWLAWLANRVCQSVLEYG
jgi:hypothetical protein